VALQPQSIKGHRDIIKLNFELKHTVD